MSVAGGGLGCILLIGSGGAVGRIRVGISDSGLNRHVDQDFFVVKVRWILQAHIKRQ